MTTILTKENGISYLELSGSAFERGLQHGQACAQEIQQAIKDYKDNVEATFGPEYAPKVLDWALHQSNFKSDTKTYTPDLWQELQGMSEGAEVTFDDIFMIQLFEEVYEIAPVKIGLDLSEIFGHGCTAVTMRSQGRAIAGSNMDYTGNLLGKQLMLRIEDEQEESLVYSFFGSLGMMGVNRSGLSVFVTTLPQGENSDGNGVGPSVVLRALLQQGSVEEALEELKRLPQCTTMTYTLTDANTNCIVESSPSEKITQSLPEGNGVLVQTNHIHQLKQRTDIPGLFEQGQPVPGMIFLSLERELVAQKKCDAHINNANAKSLMGVLTQTPNNIYDPSFMTIMSGVVEYEEGNIKFYASAGYDPLREWSCYGFGA